MSAFVALVAAGLTVSTADAPVLGEAPLCGGDAEAGLGRFFEFPRDTSGGRSVRGAVVTAGAASAMLLILLIQVIGDGVTRSA